MNTPGSVAWACIRSRSPSSAPPVKGEVGSIARTATVLARARAARTSSAVRLDLPTPGEPVSPTTYARPESGYRASESSWRPGEPSSTIEMARATARRSPFSTRCATSVAFIGSVRDRLLALADPLPQRLQHRQCDAGLVLQDHPKLP